MQFDIGMIGDGFNYLRGNFVSDEEKELKGEEREARKKQQQQNKNKQKPKQSANPVQVEEGGVDNDQKKPKGPKHLDIYV